MARIDISRLSFYISSFVIVVSAAFMAGFYSYHTQNFAYKFVESTWADFKLLFAVSEEERPAELDGAWRAHLQPTRGLGSGVTVNERADDGAKILLVGFFDDENQARLVNRDGTVVAKWPLDFFKHFPAESRPCQIKNPLYVDIHGAMLTERGELLANYEYCGTVKVDHCGNLLWRLEEITHHSLTRAEAGGYWVLGREEWFTAEQRDRFPPFSRVNGVHKILEDYILRVSEDGEVLERVSIPQLLYDSGLEALLTATGDDFKVGGTARNELVHTNKLTELPRAISDRFPMFDAGDLALSFRELNLVVVIDGVTKRVKWHQTGPWLRQHDQEFRPDGRLSIFNNNVYKTAYQGSYTRPGTPHVTNILAIDPATRETEVIYGQRPGQEMLSVLRGQHEIFEDGGMLITEFDAGRVFELDESGAVVWEYINKFDEEFVGEITNSLRFDADYFNVDWENCK